MLKAAEDAEGIGKVCRSPLSEAVMSCPGGGGDEKTKKKKGQRKAWDFNKLKFKLVNRASRGLGFYEQMLIIVCSKVGKLNSLSSWWAPLDPSVGPLVGFMILGMLIGVEFGRKIFVIWEVSNEWLSGEPLRYDYWDGRLHRSGTFDNFKD